MQEQMPTNTVPASAALLDSMGREILVGQQCRVDVSVAISYRAEVVDIQPGAVVVKGIDSAYRSGDSIAKFTPDRITVTRQPAG